jgi:hypothetical protein
MKKSHALSCVLAVSIVVVLSGQSARPTPPVSADYVSPGPVERFAGPLNAALDGLRAPALAAHIAFLSAPALDGRALGGRGVDAAAEYIAASLALAGIPPMHPAASTGITAAPYFHPVPLREISRPSGQVTIETRRGEGVDARTFLAGVDCLFPELPPESFTAQVVWAGYGIREKSPARDDYRGLDVQGRIVAIFAGLPPAAEWQTPELIDRYNSESGRQRFAAKLDLAASLGARAVLAIEGDDLTRRLASNASAPGATFFVPFDDIARTGPAPQSDTRVASNLAANGRATTPVVRVSARVGDAMLAASGLTSASARTSEPRVLPGVTATVRLTGDERLVVGRNVLGVIRGTDPTLRDEAVVMGAHMDHLGRSGEVYYPGADDNASGVAALIEIAKAFASAPTRPKRTMVFAFWTGEEEGELGSGYYVRHPAWPLDRTSVYLNLDMIGHPWTAEEVRKLVTDTHLEHGAEFLASVKPADFIELGVADSAPGLAPLLMRAARGTGLALHLDRTDGRNGGSDYREFARRGLPFVRFFGNYFDGYHEPTDTADKLDAGQVLKMARLAFASAWLLADR